MASRVITVRWTGEERLTARMLGSRDGVYSAAARGARTLTSQAFKISQVLVPVETGSLKATGRIVNKRVGAYTYRSSILYGGASSPRFVDYAIYVHEILENQHAPPTTAKFVELAYHHTKAAAGQTIKQYVAGGLAKEFAA